MNIKLINVSMVLQPRKFKYKHRQKLRKVKFFSSSSNLIYGQVGLILVQPLRLNSRKIFRLKLFLKKAARRSDQTQRRVLVNAFPHLPITKKPAGSRMGKGKGRLSIWHSLLPTGHILVEFKNIRPGRALYFLNQVRGKIKSLSKLKFSNQNLVRSKTPIGSKQVLYQSF